MSEETASSVVIGIIGGSGLYHMDQLTFVREVNPMTPWGHPSSPITISQLPTGEQIAFIARHGKHHTHSPSAVPYAANIAALKHLGVKAILAFSAVGSLREEIRPGDFVIPDQIIDRTKGIRQASFFEGTNIVAHATFGDPFSKTFSAFLVPLVQNVLKESEGVQLHTGKCVVVMEGSLFSTRAESKMYRILGGDIINMSTLPEAKLAREAEISYALIATATDYDAWRESEEVVTVSEVLKTLHTNAETSRQVLCYPSGLGVNMPNSKVAQAVIAELHAAITSNQLTSEIEGSMEYSIVTQPAHQTASDREKLRYILPYFS
ncbi:S-methyl-5'-thioadenosine phosphorylase {ECO:0000255/HAMAP-Rule:MF_03155} {ECO:0000255/HAMAP-Rule:MF_03155}; AltName: Full=5'-methylthioadenosine phosphorylase {ECO:0000255/HAMAP-Rule:MF_03155}; Short=MTA phosphorylase {ECO:0000255/HAMAP-Rule:MF_03155}; Short=MTAP {ECO:0000255/HAMAP-Rule:MF_03155}; Short=MTAPase {ECO:0000255/HAMAP-Rule:MF_03155} [Serendipita indica DSM 11827]|uniref:S-methyl-5'-thioadenosine phosphorylase n=1 Tax=Serendipita indica (strain DSM 11827) TaxID=1109443 RepID=G4TE93_SERID|nr:S-methyl-5'-thioadenosine phosphorylase {ECO:0000255/HAMAP-Rule:MF_03155} {ECO:0000255/HAMAP-Rule:MF_03155}; AltName: Full=5'-methylthioadenosine phosphorylase {ECO:0000255/HAMAP-Rule:MF_03155}; Short=MTA phosphorylase {ECO:0000255/HAMAP-Rule:MF_03155}; Short=MTAP {ECO:0000255/HAMAP-Rule:MF_03155}; Short=MTAPase {ECO:0000255/HAMAP-Rule:MF_03155} [Serendipita indica DSM 11827]CCA69625.1 related to MEU1-multiple enhancer of UAS2 [Serendipita indica DSM 11827]